MSKMTAPWSAVLLCLVAVGAVAGRRNFTCDSCSEELEYVKMLRINEVKNTILEKLRLQSIPNITKADLEHLPPIDELISDLGFTSDMYSDQPSEPLGENTYYEEDKFHVRAEQAALFPDTEMSPKYVEISNWVMPENLLQFKISPALLTRHLKSAEFQFHFSCATLQELKSFTAVIEKVVRDRDGYRTKKGGAVEVRGHRCTTGGRWIQIDVKKELMSWFTSLGDDNLGLKFRLYDHQGLEVNLELPVNGKNRPFLKLILGDDGKVRKRRYTGINCEHSMPYKECCRYPFEVNFLDFGWSWIIAPRKYHAYYCYGECRVALNSRQHMFYIEPNSAKYHGRQMTSCCSPKSLRSINMLYMDDNKNLLHGLLTGMVVDTCSCMG